MHLMALCLWRGMGEFRDSCDQIEACDELRVLAAILGFVGRYPYMTELRSISQATTQRLSFEFRSVRLC